VLSVVKSKESGLYAKFNFNRTFITGFFGGNDSAIQLRSRAGGGFKTGQLLLLNSNLSPNNKISYIVFKNWKIKKPRNFGVFQQSED